MDENTGNEPIVENTPPADDNAPLSTPIDSLLGDDEGEDTGTGDGGTPSTTGTPGEKPSTPAAGINEYGKPYYTVEEMRNTPPDKVDTSRIPPEHVPFYRAMYAGWNKKFMELSEERRRDALAREERMSPQEKVFAQYMQDPEKVVGDINAKIRELRAADPNDDRIDALSTLKDHLHVRRTKYLEHQAMVDSVVNASWAELQSSIPDFETRAPQLDSIAVQHGFEPHEIALLTNPGTYIMTPTGPIPMGKLSTKITKFVNAFYEMANAGKTANGKRVTAKPPATAAPAAANPSGPKSIKSLSDEEFEKAIAKAKGF